ncbi:unnamed protein product [Cyprideis torosa]|uniref:Uncharacterized protein n=1 Tax=Cyprideis torosa TaxID=163714 RepID=A0A7R8WLW3_9CRUS|nr:unnamed protein product [Cyprideis torosa]CAG0898560.1 unnamed protein product [Cyprideis torosa]
MTGCGVYVLEGPVARDEAGPSAIVAFLVAGLVTLMAAMCFAEFAVLIPKAGSAYVYTYVTLGELFAFMIGWNLMVVAISAPIPLSHTFSAYLDSVANYAISNGTISVFGKYNVPVLAEYPDILGAALVACITLVLAKGVNESSVVNNIFTCSNMLVILFVIVSGLVFADFKRWTDVEGQNDYGKCGLG